MSNKEETLSKGQRFKLRSACLQIAAHEQEDNPAIVKLMDQINANRVAAQKREDKLRIQVEKILEKHIGAQYRFSKDEWIAREVPRTIKDRRNRK